MVLNERERQGLGVVNFCQMLPLQKTPLNNTVSRNTTRVSV